MQMLQTSFQRAIDEKTPCHHCGLEVGAYPIVEENHAFCCTSCQLVYGALHQNGLEATFYQLSEAEGISIRPKTATKVENDLTLATLDDAEFLAAHTALQENGSRKATLFLEGLHCAACVWLIEQMPQFLQGVQFAQVDLSRAQLQLSWFPDQIQLSQVAKWLAKFGYQLHPFHAERHQTQDKAERSLLIRLGVAWALAGNIMLLAFALYSGLEQGSPKLAFFAKWVSFILAIPSIVYGGQPFFQKAYYSLKMAFQTRSWARLDMDVPIALGVLMGFLYSTYQTLFGNGEVWFDSLAVLIAALLTARWLHLRSHRLARNASDQLLAVVPTMARRVQGKWTGDLNQPFEAVSVNVLQSNDIVLVRAGDVIPADGILVHGATSINNAILTGESKPMKAEVGDTVQAGTTNLSAPIHVAVQAAGEQARIGKLLAFVQEKAAKPTIFQHWADQIGSYFIAIMLLLSALCFLFWVRVDVHSAINNTIALLVIACPCALAMASPLGMALAAGRAARKGIYIKSSSSFHQLCAVDTLIMDKTGTITEGNLSVLSTQSFVQNAKDVDAIEKAAYLETQSNHPLAKAFLLRFPNAEHLVDKNRVQVRIENATHQGISGWVNNDYVEVGRPEWLLQKYSNQTCETACELAKSWFQQVANEGATPVAVAINHKLCAGVAIGDRIRPEAFSLIQKWQKSGKHVILLSGDHPSVVQYVGKQLGLPENALIGHATPEQKQAFVQAQQAQGKIVAMIGDGVNDAAALRQSNIGIAVEGGSTAGMVSADVFLTHEGLLPIDELLASALRVNRVVNRNLGFSLVYNLVGAISAILGMVNPLVAAFAMPLSSLVVVGSSIFNARRK